MAGPRYVAGILAALGLGVAWAEPPAPQAPAWGSMVTVQEFGGRKHQCVILSTAVGADGMRTFEAQSIDSGERFTIEDLTTPAKAVKSADNASAGAASAQVPHPPVATVPASQVVPFSAPASVGSGGPLRESYRPTASSAIPATVTAPAPAPAAAPFSERPVSPTTPTPGASDSVFWRTPPTPAARPAFTLGSHSPDGPGQRTQQPSLPVPANGGASLPLAQPMPAKSSLPAVAAAGYKPAPPPAALAGMPLSQDPAAPHAGQPSDWRVSWGQANDHSSRYALGRALPQADTSRPDPLMNPQGYDHLAQKPWVDEERISKRFGGSVVMSAAPAGANPATVTAHGTTAPLSSAGPIRSDASAPLFASMPATSPANAPPGSAIQSISPPQGGQISSVGVSRPSAAANPGASQSALTSSSQSPFSPAQTSQGNMPSGYAQLPANAAPVQTRSNAALEHSRSPYQAVTSTPSSASAEARPGAVTRPASCEVDVMTLRDGPMAPARVQAAERLGMVNWHEHPEAVECLLWSARHDPVGTVRGACVRALDRLRIDNFLIRNTLEALGSDPDPNVRNEARLALSRFGAKGPGAR